MKKPFIVIPIGDPAGIGPEIAVKAMVSDEVLCAANCVLVGDEKIVANAICITGVRAKINLISEPYAGEFSAGIINLIDLNNMDLSEFEFGKVSAACGRAAYEYIEKCVSLALSGKADAVATTPINKEALRAGGVNFIGHTEIFGALTGSRNPLTMFETNGMRIFFLTRHISLREVPDKITKQNIKKCVKECAAALEKLGVSGGTLAVAGLNPHSGEHGLFGNEEVQEVIPAVAELISEGYSVEGPIGADSVFHLAKTGKYAAVLSLYHDQGHIAAKTLDFEKTVSVTNGMPILRTSVDHGTAFDIAGTGKASAVSMIEAIKVAAAYAPHFSRV